MGLDPPLYLLNTFRGLPQKIAHPDLGEVFARHPSGDTAMTRTVLDALADHKRENAERPPDQQRLLQLIIVTDGEANYPDARHDLLVCNARDSHCACNFPMSAMAGVQRRLGRDPEPAARRRAGVPHGPFARAGGH